MSDDAIEKVSIIISKGSLDGIYPGLIMANGARAEGIEANLFFTFFGLDAIHRKRHEHIKVATVGNPGLHVATWLGGFPGMSSVLTHVMEKQIEALDIPSIPEFVALAEEVSGEDLEAFFDAWLYTAARPAPTEANGFPPDFQQGLAARSSRSAVPDSWAQIRHTHALLARHERR